MDDTIVNLITGIITALCGGLAAIIGSYFKNKKTKILVKEIGEQVQREEQLGYYFTGVVYRCTDTINLEPTDDLSDYLLAKINEVRNIKSNKKEFCIDMTKLIDFNQRFVDQIMIIIEDVKINNAIVLKLCIPELKIFDPLVERIANKLVSLDDEGDYDDNIDIYRKKAIIK